MLRSGFRKEELGFMWLSLKRSASGIEICGFGVWGFIHVRVVLIICRVTIKKFPCPDFPGGRL